MAEEQKPGIFDLFSSSIVDRIGDRRAFTALVANFYQQYAELWDCSVDISERRVGDAYDFWNADTQRTLLKGIGGESSTLDHFKHAAFIAFWLRRMAPINTIWWLRNGEWSEAHSHSAMDSVPDDAIIVGPSKEQRFFAKFGSELCALMTGYHICLAYEISARRVPDDQWLSVITAAQPPGRFLFEYPKLLKHKNISSHGVYMIYHALFATAPLPALVGEG